MVMTRVLSEASPEQLIVENEFEERLNMFTSEVESANQFYYASMAIHHTYSIDQEVKKTLDEFRLVTLTMLGSLQTSLLVTFGRIFDDESKYTVHKLLQFMRKHQEMFTTEALHARKARLAKPASVEAWIDQFQSYPPSEEVFTEFGRLLRPHRKMYESKLSGIRDKWIAHRELNGFEANNLFGKTQMVEVEDALSFLLGLGLGLWQWFYNGTKPSVVQDLEGYERTHPLEPKFSMRHQKKTAEQMESFLRRLNQGNLEQTSQQIQKPP